MPLPDHIQEFAPARAFREDDPTTNYWIRNGRILFRGYEIKGADVETFWFYLGNFAKDHKHCYCTSTRLVGGSGATFRALNYAYATDGTWVWTMGGKIADADAASFDVCDDGVCRLESGSMIPSGFAKDKDRIYHENFHGKAMWVRKASPASFVSLNDGIYGKDERFVFYGAVTLPKANVAQWCLLGNNYSRDNARVYYCNDPIPEADAGTFELIDNARNYALAKDRYRYYKNGRVASEVQP